MKVDGRELSPHGLSKLLSSLSKRERTKALKSLDPEVLYQTLRDLPSAFRGEFLNHAPVNRIITLIENMPDHHAIDFLQEIDEKRRDRILRQLDAKTRSELEELLNYPPDTAGGLMTKRIFLANKNKTIKQFLDSVSKVPDKVYLINRKGRFFGQVPAKNLLKQKPNTRLIDIADRDVFTIDPFANQEDVIKIFLETDRYSLPVVDAKQKIVGEITVDNVMDAMQREASEDLSKLAGTVEDIEDIANKPTIHSAKARLPWLMFTVFGEILFTGNIIHYFDGLLEKYISLSFFLPVLMCLSGDSSIQSSIMAIQGLSKDQIKDTRGFLFRDLRVGAFLGVSLGLISMLVSLIWLHSLKIGLIVGISITLSLVAANFVGTLLPILFEKMGKDPSVSTGPLLTTTMDIISMTTYFVVATLLLEIFFI